MTHAANRLRRRKAQRATAPTADDMARWARLVEVSRTAALSPESDPKPVARARHRVRGRSMPRGQATVGSVFDRLCRLTLRWPSMTDAARRAEAAGLAGLAGACGQILDALTGEPAHRLRADIEG